MGPASRPSPINLVNPPASPRPGSGRPTSELLSAGGMFQTPEGKHLLLCMPFFHVLTALSSVAEAIDQWFENLQNYEATLVRDDSYDRNLCLMPLLGRDGCCLS